MLDEKLKSILYNFLFCDHLNQMHTVYGFVNKFYFCEVCFFGCQTNWS